MKLDHPTVYFLITLIFLLFFSEQFYKKLYDDAEDEEEELTEEVAEEEEEYEEEPEPAKPRKSLFARRQPKEEEPEEEEVPEEPVAERPRPSRTYARAVAPMRTAPARGGMEVNMIRPTSMDDARDICDMLLSGSILPSASSISLPAPAIPSTAICRRSRPISSSSRRATSS